MHQAVELILKRMDSNPDEFTGDSKDRWMRMLKRYEAFFSQEERDAILEKQNAIMMGEFHKEVMAELLYGDERRREESEAQAQMAQMKMQSQIMRNAAQNLSAIQPGSIYALSANSAVSNTVTIDGETIDKPLIQKLKALVK
jgi:hypothetical protein